MRVCCALYIDKAVQVMKKTLDPVWKPFEISMQKLNNGDLDRPLLITVWDWNRNASPGQFLVSLHIAQFDH